MLLSHAPSSSAILDSHDSVQSEVSSNEAASALHCPAVPIAGHPVPPVVAAITERIQSGPISAYSSPTIEDRAILDTMIEYLKNSIETCHAAFDGLPVCPFARKARVKNRIQYEVYPFSTRDLASDSWLIQAAKKFALSQHKYDLLLVIHPNPRAMDLVAMQRLTQALNDSLAADDLLLFDGHPLDDFNIQGVRTRNAPFIHLTVQTKKAVKAASDILSKTNYYKNWTPEQLELVGLPR